jgi:hypothetical protein
MGAWGAGSFENDAALDYVGEIGGLSDVEAALKVAGVEAIDADEASRVIVAAECVAAMRGHPHGDIPAELAAQVPGWGKPSLALFNQARDNLSAVMSRGELLELWVEEGSGDWNRAVTDLMERLNLPQAKPKKAVKEKSKTPNPSPCMFCDKPMGDGEFHMLDVTVHEDEISSSKRGGWVHLQCLNAALHPRHMIQNWQFDDELLEFVMRKLKEEREG